MKKTTLLMILAALLLFLSGCSPETVPGGGQLTPPSGVKLVETGQTDLTFSWDAVSGADYYIGRLETSSGELVAGGITEQTTQVFENIKNVLAEAGLTTANIVKTTVFLADMSLFAEMNAVYAKYFEGECPARSAFAVKGLPKGALVEIESIAVR